MKKILAIDPGTTKSGYVGYKIEAGGDPDRMPVGEIVESGIGSNYYVKRRIGEGMWKHENEEEGSGYDYLAIEWLSCFGMKVGATVFDTCRWVGRFMEAWAHNEERLILVPRMVIKRHLCNSHRAKDPQIRRALIERYGGEETAIGGKKCKVCRGAGKRGRGKARCDCVVCGGSGWEFPPGPLKPIAGHMWSALGVAVVAGDLFRRDGEDFWTADL